MSEAQQVNVADLDLSQLGDVRKQLEEELGHLTSSFAQLKQAQVKFKTCIENIGDVKPQNKDKTILVPLTNSLYVPGKICDTENVIVDVGTGYYVQKSRVEAVKHYSDKVEFLNNNLVVLEDTISKKRENMTYLLNVMQSKLQAEAKTVAKS
ncbi:Prefoldin subunit-domain-containing protein [Armillaria luteobubalina]|uniref:Prefoldin subunit-domain-containing protein n=1 Tax=Armillaria luteobubalina TaxID=153913 RepID=A0AA39Q8Q8_9AGAR|nr:Prefoldin subunit-domain-containing protein [Armillaria luteobubalina]